MNALICGVYVEIIDAKSTGTKAGNFSDTLPKLLSQAGKRVVDAVKKADFSVYLNSDLPIPGRLFLNLELLQGLIDLLTADGGRAGLHNGVDHSVHLLKGRLETFFKNIATLFDSKLDNLYERIHLANLNDEFQTGVRLLGRNTVRFAEASYLYYHDLFTDSFVDRNGVAFGRGTTTKVEGLAGSAIQGSSLDKQVSAEVVSILTSAFIELVFDHIFHVPLNYQPVGDKEKDAQALRKFTSCNAEVIQAPLQVRVDGDPAKDYSKLVGLLVAKAAAKSAAQVKSLIGIAAKGAWAGSANNEALSELAASVAGSIAKKLSEALTYYSLNAMITEWSQKTDLKFKLPFDQNDPPREYDFIDLFDYIQTRLIR